MPSADVILVPHDARNTQKMLSEGYKILPILFTLEVQFMVSDSCDYCQFLPLHPETVFIVVAFTVSLNEMLFANPYTLFQQTLSGLTA